MLLTFLMSSLSIYSESAQDMERKFASNSVQTTLHMNKTYLNLLYLKYTSVT